MFDVSSVFHNITRLWRVRFLDRGFPWPRLKGYPDGQPKENCDPLIGRALYSVWEILKKLLGLFKRARIPLSRVGVGGAAYRHPLYSHYPLTLSSTHLPPSTRTSPAQKEERVYTVCWTSINLSSTYLGGCGIRLDIIQSKLIRAQDCL